MSEINYFTNDFPIVAGIAFAADCVLCHVHLLSQFAIVAISEERNV